MILSQLFYTGFRGRSQTTFTREGGQVVQKCPLFVNNYKVQGVSFRNGLYELALTDRYASQIQFEDGSVMLRQGIFGYHNYFSKKLTSAGLNGLRQKGYQISVKNWIFDDLFHNKGPVMVILVPGIIESSGPVNFLMK